MPRDALEDIEIRLLLEAVKLRYGHDFTAYSPVSLKRRLRHWLSESDYDNFSQAQAAILRHAAEFDGLLSSITVNVSEMFRQPPMFRALRQHVLPFLRTFPHVKIWVAGCATGEEAYSLAILLHEEGLAPRCRIYATDLNERVLQEARAGIFPLDRVRRYTRNYLESGGRGDFSDYYSARYEHAIFAAHLRRNMVFAAHSLVSDGEFGEMHLILCCNVLIYFTAPLADRVVKLFTGCLRPGGYLALGARESLNHRSCRADYSEVESGLALYRRAYEA